MVRQVLKILLPVVAIFSLTLGALAWSASSVAFAASQPSQGQSAPTPTPTPVYTYGAGYAAPFYGNNNYGLNNRENRLDDEEVPGKNMKNFSFEFRRGREGSEAFCFPRRAC